MKKTYNINLSGYGFVIDEDAYQILDSYLATLAQICGRAGQQETAADIEQRIAEIFIERCSVGGLQIITRVEVENVISRIGSPEEIMDVESDGPGQASTPGMCPPPPVFSMPIEKRLYRDVDHKILGGVCSGLAWYTGIDVVWIRILMVVVALLSASTMALIYIVLWIVIPPARSPFERMQMMGMNPSMRNVGKVVTDGYSPRPSKDIPMGDIQGSPGQTTAASVGKVILMIFTVLGLIIVGSLLVAMSVAFLACLIAFAVLPGVRDSSIVEARLVMGCIIGGSLAVGIPLFLLFRMLLGVLTERQYPRFSTEQRLLLWIPWLLGIAACIVCGILLG